MSEPTAAAKRAAEAHFGHKVCKPNATNVVFVNRLAETIDRETGLPELIAALRRQMQSHESIAMCLRHGPTQAGIEACMKQCDRFADEARDALRKAGAL